MGPIVHQQTDLAIVQGGGVDNYVKNLVVHCGNLLIRKMTVYALAVVVFKQTV
jgi:hypothetical protein